MSFAEAWAAAADVAGRLTEPQARRLFGAAAAVPAGGRIVEIGSFRGRSAIVLARGARSGVEVVCIDPHVGSALAEDDHRAFRGTLERAGVADRVGHVRDLSSLALRAFDGPVDLLVVDGAHRFGRARADLVRWGARVPAGGRMLVNDACASVGVTLALLTSVVPSRSWRYVGRDGSLAAYVRERAVGGGRELGQLAFFGRNLVRKAVVAAGVREGSWPN